MTKSLIGSGRLPAVLIAMLMISCAGASVFSSGGSDGADTGDVPPAFSPAYAPVTEVPDGWIGIYSADDLAKIGNDPSYPLDGKYLQMADIVYPQPPGLRNNHTPIGTSDDPFTGEYDGNGYLILGMNVFVDAGGSGSAVAGMFGYVENATMSDIVLIAARMYAQNSGEPNDADLYAAGIAAVSSGTSHFSGIYFDGFVNSSLGGCTYAAGIVASAETANISDCMTSGSVSSAAHHESADKTACAAGIAAKLDDNASVIKNSYSIGYISTANVTDPSAAAITATFGTVISCYSLYEYGDTPFCGPQADITDGSGYRTADEMRTQSTYEGWDFDNTWIMPSFHNVNKGRPYLAIFGDIPELDADAVELKAFAGIPFTYEIPTSPAGTIRNISGDAYCTSPDGFLKPSVCTLFGTPAVPGTYTLNVTVYWKHFDVFRELTITITVTEPEIGFSGFSETIRGVAGASVGYVPPMTPGGTIAAAGSGSAAEGGPFSWSASEGKLTGTAAAGTYEVTLTGTWNDPVMLPAQTVTIIVHDPSSLPGFSDAGVTFEIGTGGSFEYVPSFSSGSGPAGSSGTGPSGAMPSVTMAAGNGLAAEGGFLSFSDTPRLHGIPERPGTYDVVMTGVWDVSGLIVTDTQTVTIVVTGVQDIVEDPDRGDGSEDTRSDLDDARIYGTVVLGIIVLISFALGARRFAIILAVCAAIWIAATFALEGTGIFDELVKWLEELP